MTPTMISLIFEITLKFIIYSRLDNQLCAGGGGVIMFSFEELEDMHF